MKDNSNILCTFLDYIKGIFETLENASKEDLNQAIAELAEMTPPPMNEMLSREDRGEALLKRKQEWRNHHQMYHQLPVSCLEVAKLL